MASKSCKSIKSGSIPKDLNSHPFYGFTLNEEQKELRDSIWDKDKKIVFCNAKAGTGKSFVSIATANLLVKYGLYEGIVYVISPYGEERQGFLPGTITEKSEVYFEPFYQAFIKIGENPFTGIDNGSLTNQKNGTGYVSLLTHTFLRGTTLENKVVILDETQNYNFSDLKKTLTRISDNSKVIVIGHDGQCDIAHENKNAFLRYIDHFKDEEYCAVVELKENFRGVISRHADELI